MNSELKKFIKGVVVVTFWITMMVTLAITEVGNTPDSNEPFTWWIVPMVIVVTILPINWGWELRGFYEKYK